MELHMGLYADAGVQTDVNHLNVQGFLGIDGAQAAL
jgi:hypothetical protein